MTLRLRIAVATALAVAIAIIAAGAGVYLAARSTLRSELDRTLIERADEVRLRIRFDPFSGPLLVPEAGFGAARTLIQLIDRVGYARPAEGQEDTFTFSDRALAVANGASPAYFSDVTETEVELRVFTTPAPIPGVALQVATSLEQTTAALRRLATIIATVILIGVAAAAIAGYAIARAITRPVLRLTQTAARVARTRDLSERIEVSSHDELGRLAEAFNLMLAGLDGSITAQRQLVADASHELRTPLASLRTNIEVLARGLPDGTSDDHRRIVADLVSQSAALSRLIADLLDLARDADPNELFEEAHLDEIIDAAIDQISAAFPSARFQPDLEPCLVRGIPVRLDRLAANLLENAAKWNPLVAPPVEVRLTADGVLAVRDHGPGVAEDDRERIFERFWRTPGARGTPGSGLGLAIVRRIVRDHGGTVAVEDADGGGARFLVTLPAIKSSPIEAPSTE